MIFISAGHHPSKPGACFEGFCEHEEAKVWQYSIANYLGHDGMIVPNGVLRNKVQFINELATSKSIAVEIHFNSFKIWEDANRDGIVTDDELKNAGEGSETLYYPRSDKGKTLAEEIQHSLGNIFKPDRGAKEGWYRMNPKNGADFFLRKTACTAIIIEPEFIHLKDKIVDNRNGACAVIAKTLLEHYRS